MASYNKVILMGHLTRDPQIKYLPSGTPVCDIGLAVNRAWKDASGNAQEEVLFVDCSAFGKLGENVNEHFQKGRPIHIEGRLKLDQWEQDGQYRSKIRVIVEQFRFVDRKTESARPAKRNGRSNKRRGNGKSAAPAQVPVVEGELVGAGDEIPI
jgi:single-strand DNA-binding protein